MSAVRLDRALVPVMIAQGGGGAVLHVGSNAARLPRPASLPYTAAKAALTAYSKGLAADVGRHGIPVNVVLPGMIPTDALDARLAAMARVTERPVCRIHICPQIYGIQIGVMLTSETAPERIAVARPLYQTLAGASWFTPCCYSGFSVFRNCPLTTIGVYRVKHG